MRVTRHTITKPRLRLAPAPRPGWAFAGTKAYQGSEAFNSHQPFHHAQAFGAAQPFHGGPLHAIMHGNYAS
jgi:hypothetical protein